MVDSGEKWGMSMFIGEYHHTIDEKGRIIIPAKFRESLGKEFIINKEQAEIVKWMLICLFFSRMGENCFKIKKITFH